MYFTFDTPIINSYGMKTNFLLPNKFKKIGWVLFLIGIVTGVFMYSDLLDNDVLQVKVLSIYHEGILSEKTSFFKIIKNGILDEIVALIIIVGGLIVGFSKEKIEDEFIYKLRTESLVWALILNYVILVVAIVFVYDISFFNVLIFNMFTPLLFFIIRFNFLKRKSSSYEE